MATGDFTTEGQLNALTTALGTAVKANTPKTAAVTFVNHGATASTARPTGYAMVIWYGSVQPTNMVAPDIVIRTDEAI